MTKCDIFFDTNLIKLRGNYFDTCQIITGARCEIGELISPQYNYNFCQGPIAGVALASAEAGEQVPIIYKADRIILPYFNDWPIRPAGTILPINFWYSNNRTVYCVWENTCNFGLVRNLEPLEYAPGPSYDSPKYALFELFGGIKQRVYEPRPDNTGT